MKKLLSLSIMFSLLIAVQVSAAIEAVPTHDHSYASFDTDSSSSGITGLLGILIPLVFYIFYSYCQFTLMKKLNVEGAGLSWIPFISVIPLLRSAGMSGWWILGLFVPLLNIYVIIKMLHNGVSLRTGHGAGWTVGLVLLGAIMFPITALTYNRPTQPTPAP